MLQQHEEERCSLTACDIPVALPLLFPLFGRAVVLADGTDGDGEPQGVLARRSAGAIPAGHHGPPQEVVGAGDRVGGWAPRSWRELSSVIAAMGRKRVDTSATALCCCWIVSKSVPCLPTVAEPAGWLSPATLEDVQRHRSLGLSGKEISSSLQAKPRSVTLEKGLSDGQASTRCYGNSLIESRARQAQGC